MQPALPSTSRSLVERISRGDRGAEEEFANTFLPRIQSFVCARTHDREMALEIGQETVLAVVCAARDSKVREPDSLAAFVYGTARNLMNDALRRRSQERLDPLTGDFPEPAARSSHEESGQLEAAHHAIDKLDSSDRRILLMTLVDGLKPGAIAEQTGLSSMVVRQRKRRALKRVIELLNLPVTKASFRPLPMEGRGGGL